MITGCVVFGKFHVCELLPILSLWKLQKKVTMQSLCLRSGDLCFPFFRADYPHKLYGIPYGRFVFSPTIIYLLNHYQSSINISMESNVGFFFFWMSLPSGTITLFQAHLVSPFLSPKNNYFSRMSRSFYWRVVLETYLSATCVYC